VELYYHSPIRLHSVVLNQAYEQFCLCVYKSIKLSDYTNGTGLRTFPQYNPYLRVLIQLALWSLCSFTANADQCVCFICLIQLVLFVKFLNEGPFLLILYYVQFQIYLKLQYTGYVFMDVKYKINCLEKWNKYA
jgi:hypothetical protein